MRLKEFLALDEQYDLTFTRKVGVYGLNGSYNKIFIDSPNTAKKFASYLASVGAKNIETGRRGKEYLLSWTDKWVDSAEWRKQGMPEKAESN